MPEMQRGTLAAPLVAVDLFSRTEMELGVYDGRAFLHGRVCSWNTPAHDDGTEYRASSLVWHPDGFALRDEHDGPTLGHSIRYNEADDGLDVLFELDDDASIMAVARRVIDGAAALSITTMGEMYGAGRTATGRRSVYHADLIDVALVDRADIPGSMVYNIVTPEEVLTRSRGIAGGEFRYTKGPYAYLPRLDVLEPRGATSIYRPLNQLEVRSAGGHHEIAGLAVPYNVPTDRTAKGRELFRSGAFAAAVADPSRVKLRDENHAPGRRPVGVATSLTETPEGLFGVWRVHNTPEGVSAYENAREGTYGGLSIGFRARREQQVNGVREILAADLDHVSLVDEPAYTDARVTSLRTAG